MFITKSRYLSFLMYKRTSSVRKASNVVVGSYMYLLPLLLSWGRGLCNFLANVYSRKLNKLFTNIGVFFKSYIKQL